MKKLRDGFIISFLALTALMLCFYNFSSTEYKITDQEVYLKITPSTTEEELRIIQKELLVEQNILMDFSNSRFDWSGEIDVLELSIDCNNGYSGNTSTDWMGLAITDFGFRKTEGQQGRVRFEIGAVY